MTKHDDDAAERAQRLEPMPDLVERYRDLLSDHVRAGEENTRLRIELAQAQQRLAYYRTLLAEKFGFVPIAPPGTFVQDE